MTCPKPRAGGPWGVSGGLGWSVLIEIGSIFFHQELGTRQIFESGFSSGFSSSVRSSVIDTSFSTVAGDNILPQKFFEIIS
jgi:hypothetical protein